ncbi:hypothetical protein CFC21_000233 [Triticum aestivum]|uniref:F-box domain-containing protein n=1 Tax=Triticum aestivum TaxID=4565 RepID=A0A3B5XTN3_WHEAT|nr:hypothetical protein CFC21_000233 [Triticum aestivum]
MEETAVVVAAGEAPASSTGFDWSKLPADLLLRIFGSLQIRDLFSSGGVCSSWRRSHLEARRLRLLCSPHHSPCLVYSAADRDDGMATLHHLCKDKLYHFTIPGPAFRSRYVMGSSHGWLITADDRSHLILVNPITGAQVAMPPPETMHNVKLRYGEEGRRLDGYDLIYADTVPHRKIEPYPLSLEQGRFCFYMVVAMSCDPSSKNCVVVRVHMPKNLLSYARVGDTKWTWVDTHEECKSYVDVCYNSGDGLFYALRGCGDVHTIDLRGPSAVVNIVYKHKACYYTDSKYIVQAPWGDFFQIWRWDRYQDEEKERVTARFVVYKIDFVKQKLTRVHNLKDHTLFMGVNTSFLVPAKDFPTLIPNSIYHTDDLNHNTFSKRLGLRQVFIFNMEDSSFTNILAPVSSRLNWPPSVWILS